MNLHQHSSYGAIPDERLVAESFMSLMRILDEMKQI